MRWSGRGRAVAEDNAIGLELLGRWQMSVQRRVVTVGSRQQRLLAALAVYGSRSRRFLGGLLWPDCTEQHAQGSLRAAVFSVSRRIPGALESHGAELALGARVEVDLHRLRDVLDGPDAPDPAGADDRWLADRSRAELLPGWYDDWVVAEQDRLVADYVIGMERRAQSALARGDGYRALTLARAAYDLDPLRESAIRLLVQGHLFLGNEAEALRAFHEHRASVARELGAEPSSQLLALIGGPRCVGAQGTIRLAEGR